jgi:hypothetical protein
MGNGMANLLRWGYSKTVPRKTPKEPPIMPRDENCLTVEMQPLSDRGNMKEPETLREKEGLTRHLMQLQGGFYARRKSLISFGAGCSAERSLPFRPLWSSSSFARSSFEDVSRP